ncbi:MAG: hypothetical protein JSV80_02685 [Acidobacteriota bacterium]|nr:MAG: hypothetical protein JSV80_02685 [Acidobacteriota bacterium]
MTSSHDHPTSRRAEAYFTASFEGARRLAEGRGDEAVEILRRELERVQDTDEIAGRRFLLSQIALCHTRMDDPAATQQVLEEMEEQLPQESETALLLAEGYLLLLDNAERASHHAALDLKWCEREEHADLAELLSRAHSLMARSLLAQDDLTGAFGSWQSAPLPDWRVAVKLIEAGLSTRQVREVLSDALPRHREHERRLGPGAVAATDQVERLILWIDAGCPEGPPVSS